MVSIHLEGMGLNGALIAHQLARFDVPFTWHDLDMIGLSPPLKTAWKASTGCIYPSGSTKFGPDADCWTIWQRWYSEQRFSAAHLERAQYWFCTKRPPHEGKYAMVAQHAGLNMGCLHSYHLNAQDFVTETRKRFASSHAIPKGANPDRYIITHGWGQRNAGAYWGWTRLVELRYDREAFGYGYDIRPCFYFRPNRVQMAYAYPVPGTPFWYAGSSIIKQKPGALRDLEIEPKYQRWKKMFTDLSHGEVEIVGEGKMLSGWRPIAADDKWLVQRDKVISLRPLWNSGIRHFPFQWYQLSKLLGIKDTCLNGPWTASSNTRSEEA